VIRSGRVADEPAASPSAVRRQLFEERLQAERTAPASASQQRARERNAARLAELRAEQLQSPRLEEMRAAALLPRVAQVAAQARAEQNKETQRQARPEKDDEKNLQELAPGKSAIKQREEEPNRSASAASDEEERQARERAEARQIRRKEDLFEAARLRQLEAQQARPQAENERAEADRVPHERELREAHRLRQAEEESARAQAARKREEALSARRQLRVEAKKAAADPDETTAKRRAPAPAREKPVSDGQQEQLELRARKPAASIREDRGNDLRDVDRAAASRMGRREQQALELAERQRIQRLARNQEPARNASDLPAAAAKLTNRKEEELPARPGRQPGPFAEPAIEPEPRPSISLKDRVPRIEAEDANQAGTRRLRPAPRLFHAPNVRARIGGMARAMASAAVSTPSAQTPATVPALQASGSFLVDENGDAVTLRGVTVRGLDNVVPQAGQTFPAALALDPSSLAAITRQWGLNLIRLPFAAGTILAGNGSLSASDLLADLDLIVAACLESGACVLLALEAAAGSQPSDANTTQVWQTLSLRYQAEPRVFYELFSSSAQLSPAILAQLPSLIAAVRQRDPSSLIFVNAGGGGIDTSNVPMVSSPNVPIANLVYTVAVPAESVLNPDQLTAASSSYPLFASVWSDDGADLGRISAHVASLFERCGIGWAAANWNADPFLVSNAAGLDFTPTLWGNVVLNAAGLSSPLMLEPADAPASLSAIRAGFSKLSLLTTAGNSIVDRNGNAVALRGVTVAGLDTAALAPGQTLPVALALDVNNLALMTGTWGINLVRIPFQAQTVLSRTTGLTAGRVLSGLDLAIAVLSDAGMYTLLALEAPSGATAPPTPDASTVRAWQTLANRYKNEPGVLYEVFASSAPLSANWPQTATGLLAVIRQQNSAALTFVSSGNGGADLTGLPLWLPNNELVPNVVYTVNVSPDSPPGSDGEALSAFADSYPVVATSWTDDADNPSRMSPYAAEFFGRHGIGFAASNWNADPRLVVDAKNQNFSSTAWGSIAMRAAKLPARTLLKPY